MDHFKYIFLLEALINTISGVCFIFNPFKNLNMLIHVNETDETNSVQNLLCRWWGAMLIMQASILVSGAFKKNIRTPVYIAMMVGELCMIPIMCHYIYQTNYSVMEPDIWFIVMLIIFLVLRVYYFLSNPKIDNLHKE